MVFCYLKVWRQHGRCSRDQDTGIKKNNHLSEAKTNVSVWVIAYLVNQKAGLNVVHIKIRRYHIAIPSFREGSLMTKRIKRCGCFVLLHTPVGRPSASGFILLCSLCLSVVSKLWKQIRENPLGYTSDSKTTPRMPKSRGRHRRGKPGRIWQLYVSPRVRICSGISKTELISLLYCKHKDKGFCNKLKIEVEGLEHGLQRRGTTTVFRNRGEKPPTRLAQRINLRFCQV